MSVPFVGLEVLLDGYDILTGPFISYISLNELEIVL